MKPGRTLFIRMFSEAYLSANSLVNEANPAQDHARSRKAGVRLECGERRNVDDYTGLLLLHDRSDESSRTNNV